MAPMNQDELKEMLDRLYGDQNRSALRISNDEKIPAADLDAAAEKCNAPLPPATSPAVKDDPVRKMTVEQLDEHRSRNRMKERKVPQGALALVTSVTPADAVPQATAPVASVTATGCLDPHTAELLLKFFGPWTSLPGRAERYEQSRRAAIRKADRQQMKTKLIAFALYYMMAALLVGIMWAAAGH
jgi:hypothetical protein